MEEQQHKKTADQLIHDNSFIIWCLCPTKESDKQWIENYLSVYPEEAETLKQAKEKVCRLKFNHTQLSLTEKIALKNRILSDYEKHRKIRYIRLGRQFAAACLFVFCLSGALYWHFLREEPVQKVDIPILAEIRPDPEQKEIELHLSKGKIKVTDNSTISIDKKGNIQVTEIERKTVNQTPPPEQQGEKRHFNRLSVPNGRRSSLILSDGTKVWVNSGTILQFPETFEKEKRTLYVNGEIYIEVAKDPHWPFYLKTDQMEVEVLGTSFGITAYGDEPSQAVILKEGSVSVRNGKGDRQTIRPNQCLTVEGEAMTVKEVDIYDYISWINGTLQFHEKNLQDVLRSLARYYRVQFDCPTDIGQIKCSGNLVLFDDINQILQTLQQTLSVSFSHHEKTIKVEFIHKQ